MMATDHIVLAFLWIFYGVVHSVLAAIRVKNFFRKLMGKSFVYYRLIYTVLAFVLFAFVLYYQFSLNPVYLFGETFAISLAGYLVAGAGLFIMLVCIRKYFISLSGLRSLFEERTKNSLMVNGIHRYMRHPLYLGTFLFIWGLFLLIPQLSILVTDAVITVYTLIGIGFEEKKLVAEFGDSYRLYQRNVHMLMPFFGAKRDSQTK
jgi:protein-S-isoprenylcysteine O-methyltransferase Ste14